MKDEGEVRCFFYDMVQPVAKGAQEPKAPEGPKAPFPLKGK